jgi:pSer/pThr/pTyr-binding forkhead associated (FHA) protein
MADPVPLKIELVHIEGPLKGQIQEFEENEITVGRHPECMLRFPKDLTIISRRHARIVREGNRFKLIDTSTNGTFVNGKRVKEAYLRSGDVITFAEGGPKVSFLVSKGQGLPLPGAMDAGSAKGSEPSVGTGAAGAEASLSGAPVQTPPPVQGPPGHGEGAVQGPSRPVSSPPAGRVKANLVIQFGPSIKSFHELPVAVGSSPESEFIIHDSNLAPRHMLIHFKAGAYTVQDLTGMGKVRVNGVPAGTEMVLAGGEEIELYPGGPALKFVGEGRFAEVLREKAPVEPGPRPGGHAGVSAPSAPGPAGNRSASAGQEEKDPLSSIKKFFKGFMK